jgi:hypothetical protein
MVPPTDQDWLATVTPDGRLPYVPVNAICCPTIADWVVPAMFVAWLLV